MNLFQRYVKSLHIIVTALTLTGCGSTLAPDFGEMSEKYANILEQYQINMLFVNILRASENRPVSFLDMPSINGSGSITTTPTASALFTGESFLVRLAIFQYKADYLLSPQGLRCQLEIILISHNPP